VSLTKCTLKLAGRPSVGNRRGPGSCDRDHRGPAYGHHSLDHLAGAAPQGRVGDASIRANTRSNGNVSGYTAIGAVYNLAARLCAEAKDGQVLVSTRVAEAIEVVARLEDLGSLELKGFRRPVTAFNVTELISGASASASPRAVLGPVRPNTRTAPHPSHLGCWFSAGGERIRTFGSATRSHRRQRCRGVTPPDPGVSGGSSDRRSATRSVCRDRHDRCAGRSADSDETTNCCLSRAELNVRIHSAPAESPLRTQFGRRRLLPMRLPPRLLGALLPSTPLSAGSLIRRWSLDGASCFCDYASG
jgi:hypothetical protein